MWGGRSELSMAVSRNDKSLEPAHTNLSLPFSLSSGRISSIIGLLLLFFHLFLLLFQEYSLFSPLLPPFILFRFPYPFPHHSGKVSQIFLPSVDGIFCTMNWAVFGCCLKCWLMVPSLPGLLSFTCPAYDTLPTYAFSCL